MLRRDFCAIIATEAKISTFDTIVVSGGLFGVTDPTVLTYQ